MANLREANKAPNSLSSQPSMISLINFEANFPAKYPTIRITIKIIANERRLISEESLLKQFFKYGENMSEKLYAAQIPKIIAISDTAWLTKPLIIPDIIGGMKSARIQ
jgi:hypothetical protein